MNSEIPIRVKIMGKINSAIDEEIGSRRRGYADGVMKDINSFPIIWILHCIECKL